MGQWAFLACLAATRVLQYYLSHRQFVTFGCMLRVSGSQRGARLEVGGGVRGAGYAGRASSAVTRMRIEHRIDSQGVVQLAIDVSGPKYLRKGYV